MTTETFDWDKFFEESEKDLARLREIEKREEEVLPQEPINLEKLNSFIDKLDDDWFHVNINSFTEPFWGKVVNK
jgi:hypothetical protein